jgi:pantoate--beta-alanine ligase
MHVLHTVAECRRIRALLSGSVGFVPTMGYLHEGHMTLVRHARAENDHVAVSIFVNPAQFGPNEDFAAYPRDLNRDLAMLEKEGVGFVYNPSPEEVYPKGFETYVVPGAIAEPLEGERRPGHFRGVNTVVAKLFNTVQPARAYFGEKDAQQVRVIKRMVKDLDMPVDIVVVPTVREADGLAMSSRNIYLSERERTAALCLITGLRHAQQRWQQGERNAESLRKIVEQVIRAEPLATIDYVSIADSVSLKELHGHTEGAALISMAVRIGKTRLIDNMTLE